MESQNQTKTSHDGTAERRIPIYVTLSDAKRIFELSENGCKGCTLEDIFDAALLIGITRLEGGGK